MATPQKEDGHVDIANEIVEALAKIHLSSYESQVLWAIFRKTYGWHKKEDRITNTQIAEMTEIIEAHVSRTIKILVQKNLITKNGKKLAFQKDYDKWQKLPKGVTSHGQKLPKGVTSHGQKLPKGVIEVTNGGMKKLPMGVYTKETKRNSSKEKKRKMQNTISEALKKEPEEEKKKANKIEFDFEGYSWHGIDEDIIEDWEERFPDINIGEQLMRIREYFKTHPEKEKYIKNYAIYINDWFERSSQWKKEMSPCDKPKNEEGVCFHLWGSGCDYKCCRDCKEYDCNNRCKLAQKRKERSKGQ